MTRAVLALGSNIGDRLAYLRAAAAGIRGQLVARSTIIETPPWGPIAQDNYLNAVIIVDDSTATARDWLAEASRLEQAAGRRRVVLWGPRTLDVDVIALFDATGAPIRCTQHDLVVPHPRAHERAFVLVPWLDADSDAVLPGYGSVAELVAGLSTAERTEVRALPGLRWEEENP